jgi:hypothetical protein
MSFIVRLLRLRRRRRGRRGVEEKIVISFMVWDIKILQIPNTHNAVQN